MKTTKRIFALLLVTAMLLPALCFSVQAEEGTVVVAKAGETVQVLLTFEDCCGVSGKLQYSDPSVIASHVYVAQAPAYAELEVNYGSTDALIYKPDQVLGHLVKTTYSFAISLTVDEDAVAGDSCEITLCDAYVSDQYGRTTAVTKKVTVKVEVDYSELNAQIAIAQGLDSYRYTAESWGDMQNVLEDAIMLRNSTSQKAVDAGATALAIAIAALVEKTAGWVHIEEGKNYYYIQNDPDHYGDRDTNFTEDGMKYHDGEEQYKGWKVIDGNKYYFRQVDQPLYEKLVGWDLIRGEYYMFDDFGIFLYKCSSWNEDEDGNTIYYNKYGKKVTGILCIRGEYYQFDEETGVFVRKLGWAENEDGEVVYYIKTGEDAGKLAKGVLRIQNEYYQFDEETGVLVRKLGWSRNEDGEEVYYIKTGEDAGKLAKGVLRIQNEYYQFDEETGALVRKLGWSTNGNGEKVYYFKTGDAAGTLATGLQKINNTFYRFDENGVLQEDFAAIRSRTVKTNAGMQTAD